MRIPFKLAAVLGMLAALTVFNATAATDLKIGVVSMAKLLSQSPQAQAASKEMQQKFDSRRKELLVQQDKIKNLQNQINRNGTVMSAAQLQDLQSQLDSLQQDFNRKQSDFMDDFNAQRNEELSRLQRDILKAVQEYAQAQKYNLIIGEGVFYADSTVDVTDRVLGQLQKDFQSQSAQPAGSGGH
ncbi:MAG: OmpH family outer membrane protein [Gammaproteobacteria bacterium]|nr:OmpH family outer membrane protein [Gammaproteobacteria bacterium]